MFSQSNKHFGAWKCLNIIENRNSKHMMSLFKQKLVLNGRKKAPKSSLLALLSSSCCAVPTLHGLLLFQFSYFRGLNTLCGIVSHLAMELGGTCFISISQLVAKNAPALVEQIQHFPSLHCPRFWISFLRWVVKWTKSEIHELIAHDIDWQFE